MTTPLPAVIWGARGHAKVLYDFIDTIGYKLVALFDNDSSLKTPILEVPLFFGEAGLKEWRAMSPGTIAGFVAIGGARGRDRIEIQNLFSTYKIEIATAVHPTAFIARSAALESGVQVLAHSTVCADARIGSACIINTAASVDHECVIERGVHVAPGATLAGNVHVGTCSMIGAGATILPNIKIGNNVVIGAGAVVTRDIPDDVVAYGNPARVIKAAF